MPTSGGKGRGKTMIKKRRDGKSESIAERLLQKGRMPKKRDPWKRMLQMAAACLILALLTSQPVLASGAGAVTAKFNILKEIVATVVSSIGTIVTLWGLFEFGNSMQTQEGGAQSQAMKRISGGLIMVIAPQLLLLFQ